MLHNQIYLSLVEGGLRLPTVSLVIREDKQTKWTPAFKGVTPAGDTMDCAIHPDRCPCTVKDQLYRR